jgi:hypothetical protein
MGFASVAGGEWGVAPPSELAHLPRLYCFANAGGSAEAFRQWQPRLADVVACALLSFPDTADALASRFAPRSCRGVCSGFGHSRHGGQAVFSLRPQPRQRFGA